MSLYSNNNNTNSSSNNLVGAIGLGVSDNVDSQSVARHFTTSSFPQVEEEESWAQSGTDSLCSASATSKTTRKEKERKRSFLYFFPRADGRAQGTAMCVRRWGGCINDVAMERHQSRRDGSGCV
jgi:hypothetical protein